MTELLKSDFLRGGKSDYYFFTIANEKQECMIYIITVYEVRLEQSIRIHLNIAPKLIIIYVNEHKFVCFVNCTLHLNLAEEEEA